MINFKKINNNINYKGNRKFMKDIFWFEIEKWKYNIRYNIYISSKGRIKDADGNFVQPKTKGGYLWYQPEGKGPIAIHRLVLGTFNPVPDWEHLTVDHLDHNTRNNSVKNLEWVTEEENIRRAKIDEVKMPEGITSTATISINKKTMPVDDALRYIPLIKGVDEKDFRNQIERVLTKPDVNEMKWSGMTIAKPPIKVSIE